MFLGACYYHSTKHKSLSTSNQKLQSSVIFVGHILLPTQCTKKKAMHDEHIFLLLSHDLQNLAFVFSHHPNNLIKLTNLSLEEESLYSLKSLTYKFQTGKQQQQEKYNLHPYLYTSIYYSQFLQLQISEETNTSCIELNIR
jgi:hypothetical protein